MEPTWAHLIEPSGEPGLDYWRYFADRLVQLVDIPHSATILDLGTCDGNVLFKAMKKSESGGFGLGIDIDGDDFHKGMDKAAGLGLEDPCAFIQMDGARMGFPSGSFHCVLANFVGWDEIFDFERMQFIRSDRMTSEIMRVLRPGGQVGIGSWVSQDDIDWFVKAFNDFFLERKESEERPIHCYAKENSEGYKIILERAGFEYIKEHVEAVDFFVPDADTWWRQMQFAARECFNRIADSVELANFNEYIIAGLQQFRFPEGIRFSKTVSFSFGSKPG